MTRPDLPPPPPPASAPTPRTWVLWAHLPEYPSWNSVDDFVRIADVATLEDAVRITDALPLTLVTHCMLFVMRAGIAPMWEDPHNRDGGSFSAKVVLPPARIGELWQHMTYALVAQTLGQTPDATDHIHGLSLSPKRGAWFFKVWMRGDHWTDAAGVLALPSGIHARGCTFRRHA